jgi:hypothetical protein
MNITKSGWSTKTNRTIGPFADAAGIRADVGQTS